MIGNEPKERLASKEAAALIGVTASTLSKWRNRPFGPPCHYASPRQIYYLRAEVVAWMEDYDRQCREERRLRHEARLKAIASGVAAVAPAGDKIEEPRRSDRDVSDSVPDSEPRQAA